MDLKRQLNERIVECAQLQDQLEEEGTKKNNCIKCSVLIERQFTTNATQTDAQNPAMPAAFGSALIDQVDYDTMKGMYQKAKAKYYEQKSKCNELMAVHNDLNRKLAEVQQNYEELSAQHQLMVKNHSMVMLKYDKTKMICNGRMRTIENLQRQIDQDEVKIQEQTAIISKMQRDLDEISKNKLTAARDNSGNNADLVEKLRQTEKSLDILTEKYSRIKMVCLHRQGEIERLQKIIDVSESSKENVPLNSNGGHV